MSHPSPARPARRRCWRALAALAATAAVGGLAGGILAACQAAAPTTYVALGDSFAAGPLVPNQVDLLGCNKSDHDYPNLTAPNIHASAFVDVTCSGATNGSMTSPQVTTAGSKPPQFDALGADTKVVSITIGGNDIDFGGIATTCVNRLASFQTCRSAFVSGSHDQISDRIVALRPKVDATLAKIKALAPNAKVFVVPYASSIPIDGHSCAALPLLPGDGPWLRARFDQIDAMLKASTLAAGDTYVDVATAANGHDACADASAKWVEGIIPTSVAAPLHPTALGMQNIAAILTRAINAAVPS